MRVHFQVVEGTRRRTQVFEGIVIKRQGSGVRETFTVRKQSFGVGVERTFPVHSPEGRADRGGRPRRRPPRQALLPARAGRPRVARARAPLDRGGERGDRAGSGRGGRDAGGRRAAPRRGGARRSRPPPRRQPLRPRGRRRAPSRGRRRGQPEAARSRRRRSEAEGDEPAAEPAEQPATTESVVDGPPGRPVAKGKEKRQHNSLVELVIDRRRGARPGARHPGLSRQAVPHPERVDGAHARGRPARARRPRELPLRRPRPRRHRRLQAAVAAQPSRCGVERAERPALPGGDAGALGHELHQARRRRAGGPPEGDRGLRLHQRQAPERAVRPARPRMRHLQPARARSRSRTGSTT